MKRLLKWLLALIVVLAVGFIFILYKPGVVRGPLEQYLSNLTGYSISLEGDLRIDTGGLIEISGSDISVSGPEWASRPDLIAIGHLKVAVNTASLFKKVVLVESLQIIDMQLNLEMTADGKNNWTLIKPSDTTSTPPQTAKDTEPVVVFNNTELSDITLRYNNGEKNVEHEFVIASLSQHQQSDGMLHANLDGSFNDRPVEFTGTFGPYANLLSGRDVTYTATGLFGELELNSSGFIDDLLKPRFPEFKFDMQGPNVDEITAMLGVDDLGSGEFSLRAKGQEVNGLYETDINGKLGDVSLSASAQASDVLELDEFDLDMAINGPSLGALTRAVGVEGWPDKPFRFTVAVERMGGTLNVSDLTMDIGGTHVALDVLLTNFPSLDASRIKLSITGDDAEQFRDMLGVPGIARGPFEVRARLDVSPQQIELLQAEVTTTFGVVTLSGTLGDAPAYVGSKFHLHVDGENAHTLMAAFDVDALPDQAFSLDTRAELVENGMVLERGVLVTIKEERLELGGFLSFNPGSRGTDLEVKVSGQHLARVLRRLVGDKEFPDLPYDLGGRVRVTNQGILLENTKAEVDDIELVVTGLFGLGDQASLTSLDFDLNGEDISSLKKFPAIGDSLDILVAGQSYQAAGNFAFDPIGWRLGDVTGRMGKTDFNVDGVISNRAGLTGSSLRYSVDTPDLHGLLANQAVSSLPSGPFKSNGQVALSDDTLNVTDFSFETAEAHGEVDLALGWPISSTADARFKVDIRGDDVRHLVPKNEVFEAAPVAYSLKAVGQKRGKLLSVNQFDGGVGNLKVVLKGTVEDQPADDDVNIYFDIVSSDLSELGQLNGKPLPAQSLDIKADFKGNTQRFVFDNITGSLGESRFEGVLGVSLEGPKPVIKLTVDSDYIDVRPFQEKPGADEEPDEATSGDRLIPATPLPLDVLAAADVVIDLKVDEIRHEEDSISNLVFKGEVNAGKLSVPQFSLEGPRGNLKASLFITPTSPNRADVKVDLDTEKLLLNLGGLPDEKLSQLPTVDIGVHAIGSGGDLRELAGSINGLLYLASTGGTLENVNLSILDTFILDEVFSAIMPKSKQDDDLELSCASAVLNVTDGLVKTRPAVSFATEKITVVAKGNLDLKTEKMHLNFNATPNNALQISAGELFNPYILIGGTLSEPSVGVDPTKALLHGGAAVGTAGISVLAKGVLDRVGNTMPVCEKMLEQVKQKQFDG